MCLGGDIGALLLRNPPGCRDLVGGFLSQFSHMLEFDRKEPPPVLVDRIAFIRGEALLDRTISTCWIGSSGTGCLAARPLISMQAGVWNAMSEELKV